jgi:predicted transglutaminase-like cysteine proteinase
MNKSTGFPAWTRLATTFSAAGAPAGGFPGFPDAFSALDEISPPDVRTAPHRARAAFGLRERTVGAPAALFARKAPHKNAARERTAPIGRWLGMLGSLKEFGVRGQIAGVNRYINQAPETHQIADYAKSRPWTAPIELLQCADQSCTYALAKYLSLRLLGFHARRLRLVWMTSNSGQSHAVLTVMLSGKTLVLDSRSDVVLSDAAFAETPPYVSLNPASFCLHWHPSEPGGVQSALHHLESRPA